MLEYIWFAALVLLAITFAFRSRFLMHEGEGIDSGSWQIAAHGAALMAIVISWDRTGGVLLSSLRSALPQAGAPIAELTALALTGIAVLVVIAGIPFATFLIPTKQADK